ncbi:hypothetical protein GCM10011613_09970 [Cellvibrio zantedeschiae]|uniref:Lipoprotein n=1 Tax=Cellvibrio zantedeschiae TaxID=1237077 RepID=A0ABQ3AV64_9GAMM|nr:hypothetical protein [Cellvibrio zantedeschiae]GGY67774.1 hypothetical protein GCM10011613_09970 [Cellvibrio zantedeschiae]
MKSMLILVLAFAGLSACSDRQMYNSIQTGNKNECDNLQHVQRQECLKRLGPSYEKYEEERKKLLKDKN